MSKLPDLHQQAFTYKNKKRLQHDGGRAWIKDSQLYSARKDGDLKFETSKSQKKSSQNSSED